MQEPINPYAAPSTTEMHSKAVEWLGTPSTSLRKVASGLGLIRIGLILTIFSVLVSVFGILMIGLGGAGANALGTTALLFIGMVLVAQVLNLVGTILCLSAPAETQARGWIFASLVAELLNMIPALAARLGLYSDSEVAQSAELLLGIVAYVTFILFLRKLGQFIGRTDLAQRAVYLLLLGAVLVGLDMVFLASSVLSVEVKGQLGVRGAGMAGIALFAGVSMFIVEIVALVKYLGLLADMKSAILAGR
jgi:hypothetical protein